MNADSLHGLLQAVLDAPLLQAALLLLYSASALATAAHALLNQRDPRSAWGWIAACWLFPLAGALLYLVFGINRLQLRAQALLGVPAAPGPGPVDDALSALGAQGVDPVQLRELARIGGAMTGRPLTAGNHIQPLHNGEQAYPAMLAAIASAQHSVWLGTYIFERGAVAQRFIAALVAAQARGVQVRVLIDGMSEWLFDRAARRALQAAGVPVARFLPPRLWPPLLHLNLRNHRKLLLVDGRVAYTGGMNIRDAHGLPPSTPASTADIHFCLQGPVLAQLQQSFAADWLLATGQTLPTGAPPLACGPALCRVITDGPNEDLDKLVMILMAALGSAHQRVLVMTPYFVPGATLVAALQAAALRGVAVHLLLPARSNQRVVDWAARKALEELLQQGVRVWLRPAPFAHSKLLLVDGHYAQIGSANLDQRSLRLNFELVVEAYDRGLVEQLALHAEQVRARCTPLTLEALRSRPLAIRLRDALCWLFSPYL